jgi:hypothetical protein
VQGFQVEVVGARESGLAGFGALRLPVDTVACVASLDDCRTGIRKLVRQGTRPERTKLNRWRASSVVGKGTSRVAVGLEEVVVTWMKDQCQIELTGRVWGTYRC